MKNKSSAQFLKYYTEFYEKIYRYIYYRSYSDKDLTEDLTSTTFLKAFEKFDTFDSSQSFSSWIYAIARNTILDHFKKNPLNREISVEDNEIDVEDDVESESDKQANKAFNKEILIKYIEKLPSKMQELIILKYFNDLNTKELEDALDMNSSALRVAHHRAIKSLKDIIPANLISLLIIIILK